MRVRWIGLALALVLLGLAAGYGLASRSDGGPTEVGAARPMAAVEPSWPAEPAEVEPDPDFPALAPGLRTHRETVGVPPFSLSLPIPQGWVRTNPTSNEWRWYPNDDFVDYTYFLRVRQVGNRYQPIPAALAERISALRDAEGVSDFDVESTGKDSFTATYVDEKHRRLTMERFFPGSDGNAASYVALIGRESDRAGMADLFARITAALQQ